MNTTEYHACDFPQYLIPKESGGVEYTKGSLETHLVVLLPEETAPPTLTDPHPPQSPSLPHSVPSHHSTCALARATTEIIHREFSKCTYIGPAK